MAKENQANGKLTTQNVALLVYVGAGLILAVLALGMALGTEIAADTMPTATPTVIPAVLTVRAQNAADTEEHHGGGLGRGQGQGSHATPTPAPDLTPVPSTDSHGD